MADLLRPATAGESTAPTMKRLTLQILLTLVLFAGLAWPASAQGNVTISVDNVATSPDGKTLAYVTVRDENGVPITGLEPGNFEIIEDNATYFTPDQVSAQTNPAAGLRVALVIDLSGTMKGKPLDEAKKASARLLELLLNEANDPDRAAFFGINGPVDINDLTIHEGNREADFTNDRNKILNLINPLEVTGSTPTPLYDALFRVAKIAGRQLGPRAVIVITDGQDRVSGLSADDPIAEANRNRIPIFPIGFSTGPVNDEYLTRLAARTGATYTRARDASAFTKGFEDILAQLGQQYVLSYQSRLNPDGKPHAVMVQVKTPKGTDVGEKVFTGPVPTVQPTSVPAATEALVSEATEPAQTAPPVGPSAIPLVAEPTPAPTPAAPQTIIDRARDWLTDRSNWPILIAGLAVLLLVVALILFLVLRRPHEAEDTYAGVQPLPAEEPVTVENRVPVGTGPSTAGPGPYPRTDVPSEAGWPPPPPAPARSPMESAGQTVLIPRVPQPKKVLAILVNRKKTDERYDVTSSTEIGRATDNQIVLQSATVSRKHAKIWEDKGEFKVHDLVSANGTFVNDRRIAEPTALKDGDVVRFGEVEFLFRILT